MERLFNGACDPKQLSPLTLAFVGDAAFELFVRNLPITTQPQVLKQCLVIYI